MKYPVVRNIQNGDAYFYKGDCVFQNIRTGKEGSIEPELAQKILKTNLDATELINENPIIIEMIQKLNLKFDNNKK